MIKDNTEHVLKLLELQNSDEAHFKIDSIKQQIEAIDKDIKEKEEKLQNISVLKNKHEAHLSLPKFGSEEKFDLEEAVLSCQIFKANGQDIKLETFWHFIFQTYRGITFRTIA